MSPLLVSSPPSCCSGSALAGRAGPRGSSSVSDSDTVPGWPQQEQQQQEQQQLNTRTHSLRIADARVGRGQVGVRGTTSFRDGSYPDRILLTAKGPSVWSGPIRARLQLDTIRMRPRIAPPAADSQPAAKTRPPARKEGTKEGARAAEGIGRSRARVPAGRELCTPSVRPPRATTHN
eukprot:362796-Chlamydomonas_euryale.AAC.2